MKEERRGIASKLGLYSRWEEMMVSDRSGKWQGRRIPVMTGHVVVRGSIQDLEA